MTQEFGNSISEVWRAPLHEEFIRHRNIALNAWNKSIASVASEVAGRKKLSLAAVATHDFSGKTTSAAVAAVVENVPECSAAPARHAEMRKMCSTAPARDNSFRPDTSAAAAEDIFPNSISAASASQVVFLVKSGTEFEASDQCGSICPEIEAGGGIDSQSCRA